MRPFAASGHVLSDLARAVRDLPCSRSSLEAVVFARSAVVGVDLRGDHHVAQLDTWPQGSGDAYEEHSGGGELGDGTLGQHRRRMVALAHQTKGDSASVPAEPTDFKAGAA